MFCEMDKSPFDSFDFLTGLQVCFRLVIFKIICVLNPPEADEPAGNTAGKGLMRLRLVNSQPLGAIMDIPIDTMLLCGGVVYY